MYGRFAQAQTREEYLAYLSDEADRDIAYDLNLFADTTSHPAPKCCC
jgi:hypothetical protein